jgi:hypothetical protein
MTADPGPQFMARSRPKMWVVYVLTGAGALLTYVGFAPLGTEFAIRGRGGFLNDMPAWLRGAVFFGCAAACIVAVALQLVRKLRPQVDVEAGPDGLVSRLLWGRGRLRWGEIRTLEWQGNWLFVRGVPGGGRSKKLVIDTTGIDAPIENLYAVIAHYRPDLLH